ncbi:uncharacterized protein LOC143694802 [Agelaius phoeniceus]|uniref:uncharacterized protein LOC143694802 n=1 Tax=Agelaius phoeniceus TaxID=39638 RepID=UPI004055227A
MAAPLFAPRQRREKPSGLTLRQVPGTLRSEREPRFNAGVTVATTNPREQCQSSSVRAGWQRAGPMAAGNSPLRAGQLPALKSAARSGAERSWLRTASACRPGLLQIPE